jgi:hypothetical protein
MWRVTAPGIVCHKIRDDKGADTFRDLLGNYRGVVVCDALKTHVRMSAHREHRNRGIVNTEIGAS